ncbi:MAG: NADH-quinone oxidoreductase subunit [Betaproteobacteria bacterium]|jgi:NADH-quinone oxidoreductase subunit N|nr:NADH-quinone oxidoreductase subunit [Betaproteobacteria bacterium]
MEYIQPLWPAFPELFLLLSVCVILIADLFVRDENRVVTYGLTQGALAACIFLTWAWATREPVYTFSGMFVDDLMSDVLKLFVCLSVMVVLAYSRPYIAARGLFRGEFFALLLFATLGMMVMISANHLLVLYLGLELMMLSLYSIVALQRDSATATEAAMKYFVLGALASGMLLYGMSMIYGATGTLEITELAQLIAEGTVNWPVLIFGLVFIVAGLGFELGVVPFHMWVPDVYQGAPGAVALFVSSVPKVAGFALIIRLLGQALGAEQLSVEWQQMLVVMAVLSLVIGNVTAIVQTNLKRMLAYSTISHMGFVLLGALAGDENGYSAAMFYVIVYVLTNLGAFGMMLLLSRSGFEAENLEDFKGLNQRSPWYAFIMLLIMFSMVGIPPTVGFYAKLAVLQSLLTAGYLGVAVVAVVFSVVGAFYYLRIVKLMYFDAPEDTAPLAPAADVKVLMSLNGAAVLIFGIMPQPLMALCLYSIQASL